MSTTGTTFTIKLNAETAEALSKVFDFYSKVTGIFKEMIPGLAAGAGFAAIAERVSEAIKQVDELSKTAQKVGIAVTQLSTLSLAMKFAGVDSATMATSIRGLDKAVGEAVDENSKAAISFRELGVSLRNTDGSLKTTDEIILQLADAFAKLPDGVTKTRLATELFGRAGMNLIPLLNRGRQGIEEAQQEAQIFGLRVGPEFAEHAERYQENLIKIKSIFEGMAMTLAEALLPELLRLTDAILDFVKQSGAHVGMVNEIIGVWQALARVMAGAIFSFQALGSFMGAFAGALVETGNPFMAWDIAFEEMLKKCDRLVARLNEINALGTDLGGGKPRKTQTTEDPVDAHNRAVAAFSEEDKRIQLMLKENDLITKKFELERTYDPVVAQAKLNDQLKIELNLIQKHRTLTANAYKEGTITKDQYRQYEIKDKGQMFNAQKQMAPGSLGDELHREIHNLMQQWGTVSHQIAVTLTNTIGNAIRSISENITDVIMRTQSWGEALQKIGQSIMRQVIQSIIEMGVKYVASHILIRGAMLATAAISRALGAEQTAQNIENFTTGAMAGAGESGSQGGWIGVLIYMGVLAAAMAAVMAMAGGFAEGGFTGSGGRYEPAGIVHRGEYVFSAPAVNRLGLGNLDAMHSGAAGSTGGMGGAGNVVNIGVINDRADIPNWARSQKGESHIVDIVRRNWHKLT